MGDYTPDGIHIRSEWDFFILPLAGLIGVILLAAMTIIHARNPERRLRWHFVAIAGAILATILLYFYAFGRAGWSTHALDIVKTGWSNGEILAEIQRKTDIPLPPDATVIVGVSMGWRKYQNQYAVKMNGTKLMSDLRRLNYTERTPGSGSQRETQPELVTNWIHESGFTPTVIFHGETTDPLISVQVDPQRNLALIMVCR